LCEVFCDAGMCMVMLRYMVYGAVGYPHCGAGFLGTSRCRGQRIGGWGAGVWSPAGRDAPDGTWAASRALALHGGVRGRGGNHCPTQAAVRNAGEHGTSWEELAEAHYLVM
jgi:hypothetical protein